MIIYYNCDKSNICKRVLDEILCILLNKQGDCSASSHKEVYTAIANWHFLNDYMDRSVYTVFDLPDDAIHGLRHQYKEDFSLDEWRRICMFELHFHRHHQSSEEDTQ